jgi:hypothetical protein
MAEINPKEHALWLDREEPGCRCQRVSVSGLSPGPVADSETLIRIVLPQHIFQKTGLLKPSVLTHAESRGMSVFREERATDDQIWAAAERIVRNARAVALKQGKNKEKNVGVRGVLRMKCKDIRTFCWEDEADPCYCVYDNASRNAPAHAAAFQRIANVSAGLRDARRNALFERLKGAFLPVDQFRGGLLKSLAPERGS